MKKPTLLVSTSLLEQHPKAELYPPTQRMKAPNFGPRSLRVSRYSLSPMASDDGEKDDVKSRRLVMMVVVFLTNLKNVESEGGKRRC